jgi:NTE family protein
MNTAKIGYSIKTSFEKNQPRLLLISVGVKDCSTPVTFDSYHSYTSKCDVCNKECKDNDSLVKHIKNKHIKALVSQSESSSAGLSSSISFKK